ncbi:MAG: hypothetical protein KJ645_05375, partial [Planctomycetes bacterium]|nr:hypothetical protein [Planctomycetota bacterium]
HQPPFQNTGEKRLFVLSFSAADAVDSAWLLRCGRLLEELYPRACRIWIEKPGLSAGTPCGGAPWSARYGLDHPAFREFLTEIVAHYFPFHLPCLNWLCGLVKVGADPLEEMYAGNGLPDRNAELIENIVP